MTVDMERFERAVARFDAANLEDPNTEIADGQTYPKELLYARRMSEMLQRFAPDAAEPLRLAVRSQHIKRWTIPRAEYPMTSVGYKQWRQRLMRFHADTAAEILREVGYDEETIARVESLLQKKGLKTDPQTQALEDVIGLVFLECYLEDFVAKHGNYDETKVADILRKTWQKMSARGREAALGSIKLPKRLVPLIEKAVVSDSP